jgi:acyl-coenzyme A synthetase/AMP-(fatty) acid ligase
MIFASSGTTGASKHTAVSHDLMRRRILLKFLAVRPLEATRQISMVGVSTSYGFPNLLRVLWAGGLLVFPGNTATAERMLALVQRHEVNILLTAPASLAALLAALPPDAGRLRSR